VKIEKRLDLSFDKLESMLQEKKENYTSQIWFLFAFKKTFLFQNKECIKYL
jgi:hypothetical protein